MVAVPASRSSCKHNMVLINLSTELCFLCEYGWLITREQWFMKGSVQDKRTVLWVLNFAEVEFTTVALQV
jgi:hypothetical protein